MNEHELKLECLQLAVKFSQSVSDDEVMALAKKMYEFICSVS